MTRRLVAVALMVGTAAALAACTVKEQAAPALSGPSELATAITIYANPDTLRQDGASQAQVTVQARDERGQPVRNLPIRLDVAVGDILADFGQLSSKNLYTGSDGRAVATYTAPNAPLTADDVLSVVQILATPVGTDYAGAVTRNVQIRLVPPGIIYPPSDLPKALFTFSPSTPLAMTDVTFDASSSVAPQGSIASYAWDFGDGSTGSGRVAVHQFAAGGSFSVKLTVTDDRGFTGTKSVTVTVTSSDSPTASFVFSPIDPRTGQEVFFNASASTAAAGRRIVSYAWELGTGRTASGVTVGKTYDAAGTYTVSLTVTDDIGKTGSTSKQVTVSNGTDPTADFVFSPDPPGVGQVVRFNAATSKAAPGRSLVRYAWNFGNGKTGTGVTPTTTFDVAGTYNVSLTVTDDTGKTGTTSQAVEVGGGLTAAFTYSPLDPVGQQDVNFDASDSSGPKTITTYTWNFGDGSPEGSGKKTSHSFSICAASGGTLPQTFVVRLTVKDSSGKTAVTTEDVTVTNCK